MRFLLTVILFLAIVTGIIFFLFNKFSKLPNKQTQETAQKITKFPSALNWQIKNGKNLCVFTNDICNQPITVSFESQKPWNEVYFFYRDQMSQDGWQTNSTIFTSIPSSIVFTNNRECKAELAKHEPFFSFLNKSTNNQFAFSIICPKGEEEDPNARPF